MVSNMHLFLYKRLFVIIFSDLRGSIEYITYIHQGYFTDKKLKRLIDREVTLKCTN